MDPDQPESVEAISNQSEYGKADYIVKELKSQIQAGKLPEGTKVSSERELSDRYKVSRMTARKALDILAGEGLVTRYPVRGTFVVGIRQRRHVHHGNESYPQADPKIVEADELRYSGSFMKDMQSLGYTPEVYFLEQPALVAASPEIARRLELPEFALVLKRYRLQSADGLPYRLIESYYPADLFGEVLKIDKDKPLFEWLQEQHDLRVIRARENLIARLATKEESQLLQISPQAPVMALERTVWANNDQVVEWATIIAVAALYRFSYEYDIAGHSHAGTMIVEHGSQNGVRAD